MPIVPHWMSDHWNLQIGVRTCISVEIREYMSGLDIYAP